MNQFNLRKKCVILLTLIILFAASYSIVNVHGLEEPLVTVSSLRVHSTPPEIPAAMLDVEFKIYNPDDMNVTLYRIEYKIYVNGTQVGDQVSKFWEAIDILPNETKTIEINPVVDLSSFNDETREIILERGASWDITGIAYFITPEGTFSVSIRTNGYTLTTKITIRVKDEKDYPISSANITLQSESGKFNKVGDELGRAEFILPCENYQLKISKEGYQPYQESLNLAKPLVVVEVIQLVTSFRPTPSSRVTVEVKDEKWDHISGANVTLISKDEIFDKITNASGAVEFEIPSANYTLKVSKEGYSTHEESLDLSTPATMMKVIHLYPSIKLTVEIWDDVGKPISDVNVTFDSVDVGNFSKTTNVSGVAEFEIPRVNYTLTVSKKGYLPHEDCLDLSKSIIESKVIQLKAELTWWQQYWSAIAWIIVICVAIPVILRLKKKSLFR